MRTALVDWLFGELEPKLCKAVEAHLASCENCRVRAETFRRVTEAVASVPVPKSSVDLRRLNLAAWERMRRGRRRWHAAAIAAGVLAVLISGAVAAVTRIEILPGRIVIAWTELAGRDLGDSVDLADRSQSRTISRLQEHAARLDGLDELVRLLIAEIDSTNREQRVMFAAVERKLDELRRTTSMRMAAFAQAWNDRTPGLPQPTTQPVAMPQ
jgi:anti-sigma factor RsiW